VVDCTKKAPRARIQEWPDGAERVVLDVSYGENDVAKGMGAKFDWEAKKWYALATLDEEAKSKLLSIFGPRGDVLAADKAIDECGGGLRECIVRRTQCR